MNTFPCDICNKSVRTKVVYQTVLTPNDSEEKCEYGCTLYNIPCDTNAGSNEVGKKVVEKEQLKK